MSTMAERTDGSRRLSPADVREVRFSRSSMLHPGYSDAEVDRFLDRVGEELSRLHAEKAELRDRVHALQAEVGDARQREEPTAQAVGLLAAAQQTADQYVAEAEAFSRVMTTEARDHYEEQLRTTREKVGAMLQAAQEAATRMVAEGGAAAAAGDAPSTAQLEEQVAYLQAFGQACRTQLRSYLEALIAEVEQAWGRADPAGVPAAGSPAVRPAAAPTAAPTAAPQPTRQPAPQSVPEPATVEAAAVLLSQESLGSGAPDGEAEQVPGDAATLHRT
jgi:DivIVA domain-containing protein